MKRSLMLAVVGLLAVPAVVQAAAKQYVLPHPRHEHCRAHYVKKVETVKEREHDRAVKVRETVCVHVTPKAPAPTPEPAPQTAPEPKAPEPKAPEPAPKTGPETGPLGATLYVDHDDLSVSASVRDPVSGENEFEAPKTGSRFIAVALSLTDHGSASIESDADVDATVIGSNDQAYMAVFDETPGCTNFNSGDYSLLRGGDETGCVLYELPEGVDVQAVRFGLNLNVEAEWNA
jgi:hypothetical protein